MCIFCLRLSATFCYSSKKEVVLDQSFSPQSQQTVCAEVFPPAHCHTLSPSLSVLDFKLQCFCVPPFLVFVHVGVWSVCSFFKCVRLCQRVRVSVRVWTVSVRVWSCANDLPVAQTSVKCVEQEGRKRGGRERGRREWGRGGCESKSGAWSSPSLSSSLSHPSSRSTYLLCCFRSSLLVSSTRALNYHDALCSPQSVLRAAASKQLVTEG